MEEKNMKHSIKLNRAMELYTGFKGTATYSAVEKQLPEKLVNELTGAQLALVMQAINTAYQKGKASTGAEMIDNNAVYIEKLDKVIEWNEEGAEYTRETVVENGYRVTRSRKTKDGVLVPRFSEE
jgi:hypothetical protein